MPSADKPPSPPPTIEVESLRCSVLLTPDEAALVQQAEDKFKDFSPLLSKLRTLGLLHCEIGGEQGRLIRFDIPLALDSEDFRSDVCDDISMHIETCRRLVERLLQYLPDPAALIDGKIKAIPELEPSDQIVLSGLLLDELARRHAVVRASGEGWKESAAHARYLLQADRTLGLVTNAFAAEIAIATLRKAITERRLPFDQRGHSFHMFTEKFHALLASA